MSPIEATRSCITSRPWQDYEIHAGHGRTLSRGVKSRVLVQSIQETVVYNFFSLLRQHKREKADGEGKWSGECGSE